MLRIVPGNIVDILFDAAGMSIAADKANLQRELGIDQPIVVQYAALDRRPAARRPRLFLCLGEAGAARRSCRGFRSPRGSPALALLFSASIGVPLGVISAVKQGHGSIISCASSA